MSKRWNPRAVTGTSGEVAGIPAAPGTFGGYSLANTAASATTVIFYDNASAASGTILAVVAMAAGASETKSLVNGVAYFNGVYASFSQAGVEGSVYVD